MENIEKIKLIVLDVDGTLTDGGIYYDSQGNEMKRFDVRDGLGIKVGQAAGLEFAIITGRESPMVERRARELGIQYLVQGVQKKAPAMKALMERLGLDRENAAYMGDDWNDVPAMKLAAIAACPADADPRIRALCHYVAPRGGGSGAVRDFIQEVLERRHLWQETAREIYKGLSGQKEFCK